MKYYIRLAIILISMLVLVSCGSGDSAQTASIQIENTQYTENSIINDPRNYKFDYGVSWDVPEEIIGPNVRLCLTEVTSFLIENGTLKIGEQLGQITFDYSVGVGCYRLIIERFNADFPVAIIAYKVAAPTPFPESPKEPPVPEESSP